MSKTHSKSQLRQNHTFETEICLRSFLSHNFVKDLFQCTTMTKTHFKSPFKDKLITLF